MFCFCKFFWLVHLSESVFVKKGLGLYQNSGSSSVNTSWDLSREHWWDLIKFEFILFLSGLFACLPKTVVKYLVCTSKWRVELSVYEVAFFLFQRKLYILFSIWYLMLWNSVNFWLSFYLPKRFSLCSRYLSFAKLQLFCPIWSYRK